MSIKTLLFLTFTMYSFPAQGSVTMLSDLILNAYQGSSVTLYCHIKPFDHNRCHAWYKETEDGSSNQVLAQGSAEYTSTSPIETGSIVIPKNISTKSENPSACAASLETNNVTITAALQSEDAKDFPSNVNTGLQKYYSLRNGSHYMLTITKIEPSDEGKYFCKYYCEECDSMRTELVFTIPATLETLSLTSEPETDFVEIDELIKLTCIAKSRPAAVIQWVLVINGENVPHIEKSSLSDVVYDGSSDLYVATSVFHFTGGNINRNPMVIYCQVASPVSPAAVIAESEDDLIETETESHSHKKRKKRDADEPFVLHDHGDHKESMDIPEMAMLSDKFHYEFETISQHGHDEPAEKAVHTEYLTTYVFKRRVYTLPTAAFNRKWRIALIVISSTVLILPIVIGFIQIFVKKTGGFHIPSNDSGVQDFYKRANSISVERKPTDAGDKA